MTSSVRVLVVGDFEPFRQFIASTLQEKAELQVVAQVSDGLGAVQKAKELQPDLVLIDIGLPNLNGIEAARQIRRFAPDSRILFVSQESSPAIVQECFSLGAGGYVLKSDAGSQLFASVEAVMSGKQFVSRSLSAR